MNHFLLFLWLLLGPALSVGAEEAKIPKTGDPAWDGYIALKNDWSHQLHDLVVATQPEFKEIAGLSLKWGMADMRLETMKFDFIHKTNPEVIERDKGLPGFVKLHWFPDQAEHLRKMNAEFKKQEQTTSALKHQVETHPRWQALQDYLKDLQKSPEQKERFDQFLAEMNQVQKILAQTAADQMRKKH